MQKFLRYTLISLAILSSIFAIFAFFFPVQSNFVSGYLDNGKLFTREWFTYSYEVVGGYLLLIAAACCAYCARQVTRDILDSKELLFWTGLSIVLIVGMYLAGNTLFISWLPGVPAELQSALGTKYVQHKVSHILNAPGIIDIALIFLFAVTLVIFIASSTKKKQQVV